MIVKNPEFESAAVNKSVSVNIDKKPWYKPGRKYLAIALCGSVMAAALSVALFYELRLIPGKFYFSAQVVCGESCGEPEIGQMAVFATSPNRARSYMKKTGKQEMVTVSHIAAEFARPNGDSCMYTPACEPLPSPPPSLQVKVFKWIMWSYLGIFPDPTDGAEWFCSGRACTENPWFGKHKQKGKMEKIGVYGTQTFYKPSEEKMQKRIVPPAPPPPKPNPPKKKSSTQTAHQ